LENAQHCAFKRKHRADASKRAVMWEHLASPRATWFHDDFEESVTELAHLVNKCLDDVRARAKCCWWRPLVQQIKFLPKGVLKSVALEQYLKPQCLVVYLLRRHYTHSACSAATVPCCIFIKKEHA
jgi:hypothetical protein